MDTLLEIERDDDTYFDQQIAHFALHLINELLDDSQYLGLRPCKYTGPKINIERLGILLERIKSGNFPRHRRYKCSRTRGGDQGQCMSSRSAAVGCRGQRKPVGHTWHEFVCVAAHFQKAQKDLPFHYFLFTLLTSTVIRNSLRGLKSHFLLSLHYLLMFILLPRPDTPLKFLPRQR
jgi:hypothetical protein